MKRVLDMCILAIMEYENQSVHKYMSVLEYGYVSSTRLWLWIPVERRSRSANGDDDSIDLISCRHSAGSKQQRSLPFSNQHLAQTTSISGWCVLPINTSRLFFGDQQTKAKLTLQIYKLQVHYWKRCEFTENTSS
jgi:hypothetical protein